MNKYSKKVLNPQDYYRIAYMRNARKNYESDFKGFKLKRLNRRESQKWKNKYEKLKERKNTIEKELTKKNLATLKGVYNQNRKIKSGQVDDVDQFTDGKTPIDQQTNSIVNTLLKNYKRTAPPGTFLTTNNKYISDPVVRADRIQNEKLQINRFDKLTEREQDLYNDLANKPKFAEILASSNKTMFMFPEYYRKRV